MYLPMKYKITIEQGDDYEVTRNVYEGDDGKQYFSTYSIPDDVEYKTREHKTGKIATKYHEVYSQEVEMPDIKDVIKAANGFLYEDKPTNLSDAPFSCK
jgi:hypothetical protein